MQHITNIHAWIHNQDAVRKMLYKNSHGVDAHIPDLTKVQQDIPIRILLQRFELLRPELQILVGDFSFNLVNVDQAVFKNSRHFKHDCSQWSVVPNVNHGAVLQTSSQILAQALTKTMPPLKNNY